MDPLGLALENFDGIGKWRTLDESGAPIDASGVMPDGTKIDGVNDLRKALSRYSTQFVEVVAEKLLTYALGRGTENQDMPMVRSIVRDASASNYKFSTLVLSIVKSDMFRVNQKAPAQPGTQTASVR